MIITDRPSEELKKWFHQVVAPPSLEHPYLLKLEGLALSDADEVLFIDSDSIVFRPVEPIFDFCKTSALAIRGTSIRTGQWYGNVETYLAKLGLEAIPMINGGLIYNRRCPEGLQLMEEARQFGDTYAESGFDLFRGKVPDEPCLAVPMARSPHAMLLPDHADAMDTPAGLIGRLNMDVSKRQCTFLKRGHSVRMCRPIVFHAAKDVNTLAYWRQLDWLSANVPSG